MAARGNGPPLSPRHRCGCIFARVTSSFDRLSAALADRYRMMREIGAGGMATVFLARDLKHERDVAIKVLKPELGAVLGLERFLSEIKVTANLQHPNLLPLFDSGEAVGLSYYVMPFVEAETLRARLDREQQLPVEEAVRLATAIAAALVYAHERGVIPRDLKPENILLQAGQPVIADFGIALAVSNAGGARVTQTGLRLGTPQYMSPEQATGDKVIDARSDLYSLAAMTDEMLTGEPPHTGTNAQAIIAKLLTEEVRPLTVLRRSVPPHVDAAVRHGLEKLAADRFATAADIAAALSGARPFAMPGTAGRNAEARAAGASGPTRALPGALVFVGERRGTVGLYVRRLNDPGDIVASPTRLLKLPLSGGTAQVLADSGQSVQWGDGDVLAHSLRGVFTSTPSRRAGAKVATGDKSRGIYGVSWPGLLPGSTHALVSLTTTRSGPPVDSMRLGVVSLADGTVIDLGVRGTFARYVSSGHILFVRRPGLLMVAPFSLRQRRITRPESVLLDGVWIGSGGAGGVAVSASGTLALHRGDVGVRSRLVAVDPSGGERPIPGEAQEYFGPRVSPDRMRILARIGGSPTSPGESSRALPRNVRELSPGPAGGRAALVREGETFGSDVFLAPMDSLGALRAFVTGRGRYHSPSVSLDGRWVAWFGVEGDDLSTGQIVVTAIPGPGPRLQVSVGGGFSPRWDPSGTRLNFRRPRRVMVADLSLAPLQVTKRDSLFEDVYVGAASGLTSNWDYIPGRNAFLMVKPAQPQASVPRVVLHWPQLMAGPMASLPPR